jgi:hypothetical protein
VPAFDLGVVRVVSWTTERLGRLARRRSALSSMTAAVARAGRRAYHSRSAILSAGRTLLRLALVLAGLTLGVLAAFTLGTGWGLLASGVACWVFEAIIRDDSPDTPDRRR